MELNRVINGDAYTVLKTMEDKSINCCVTSPPYYGLRDYGVNGQIGLEETPEQYINALVKVFHEVKRVLKDDGTLWLNIGDSYWGSGSRGYDFTGKWSESSQIQSGSKGTEDLSAIPKLTGNRNGYKNKDLIGIPWMLAFALRTDGWYLRQDIIWHKPNPMPESVKDRCTKAHEYIFLLSKSQRYYFDYEQIQEDALCAEDRRKDGGRIEYGGKRADGDDEHAQQSFVKIAERRNKRDVWDVTVVPTKAGCPVGGVVLDPFFGSGTTGIVATELNRNYIGIELNPKYIEIINRRTSNIQLSMTGWI